MGRLVVPNPATDVRRRRVPQRKPDYLRPEEVVPVLAALESHFRPLFATAIYTGFRKGELFALQKRDIDFERRTITFQRRRLGAPLSPQRVRVQGVAPRLRAAPLLEVRHEAVAESARAVDSFSRSAAHDCELVNDGGHKIPRPWKRSCATRIRASPQKSTGISRRNTCKPKRTVSSCFRRHLLPARKSGAKEEKSTRENSKDSESYESAPGGTRTHDPRLRRPVLYPAELRAQRQALEITPHALAQLSGAPRARRVR